MKRLLMFFLCIICNNVPAKAQYEERSRQMGVNHLHVMGILMGGGAVMIDYDNDGYEDLFLTGGAQPDKLYRNINGQFFKDVTMNSGILASSEFITMAASAGDYNNDGHQDLFVSTDDGFRNLLFENNGDGTFTERGTEAGISTPTVWSMGSVFTDINLDGYLDLYVINYIEQNGLVYNEAGEVVGFRHDCFANELYINNQDGTFRDETQAYGAGNEGCGLAVRSTDFNDDNFPDLYVANDFGEWVIPNTALLNAYPQGTLIDISDSVALNSGIYGMGIAEGDPDADGLPDYYVTNIASNVFHHQQANRTFLERATELGIDNTFSYNQTNATSWGAFFFDFDNDGNEDLFVCNGFIGAADFLNTNLEDPNKLYKGDGQLGFTDVSTAAGIDSDWVGRGAVYADWDNDGYQDIIVANTYLNEGIGIYRAQLYKNKSDRSNHWLKVLLVGTTSNRDAFGSTIRAYTGEKVFYKHYTASGSHASHHSNFVYLGLGASEQVDSLHISWPSGEEAWLYDIQIDRTIQVVEGSSDIETLGCMDSAARNYDPAATISTGCDYPFGGCMDIRADNYDRFAEVDDGSCSYTTVGVEEVAKSSWFFANPAKDQLILVGAYFPLGKAYSLYVYNEEGKLVFQQSSWTGEALTLPYELKTGVYIVSAIDDEGTIKKQKLIIQK